ncbi:MAG: CyaA/EF/ExoY family adenylyl cyclase toxin [Gammaproteobacteria bacterium]|nr:CyaA/EF/ExoY family adenylyl cyclase toxin [Gammaproteobacteria bacterium]
MKHGAAACQLTGFPELHAEAFQEVADATKFVIASRAVGKYATGLIEESYASKGFHNKAKSCNWGPMAGFVLTDPRFTKVGGSAEGQQGQAKALDHAFHEKAAAVPVYVSDERLRWLERNVKMHVMSASPERRNYQATSPWGLQLKFTLLRERPPAATADMWRVYYHQAETESARGMQVGPYSAESDSGLISVLAVRDPLCTVRISDYRSATTGDYDLFLIFARSSQYSPDKGDRRMVSHAQLETNIRSGAPAGEDPHLGNITPRIRAVRDKLNLAIQRKGYTGGDMVHHSDEGGRPFVEDVDLPVFAVLPGASGAFGIESVEDLRQFITENVRGQYAPVLHPGWMKQMVFHSSTDIASATRHAIRQGAMLKELKKTVPRQN